MGEGRVEEGGKGVEEGREGGLRKEGWGRRKREV